GQQRPAVADQGPRRRGRLPVRPLPVRAHPPLPRLKVIRAEPRTLQTLPVHPEFLACPVRSLARLPEGGIFPRRIGGNPRGAVGTPVVRDVPCEHLLPLVEGARAYLVRVVPAVPEVAGPELLRLPAEVLFLRLAHPVGPVSEEFGVPLGE